MISLKSYIPHSGQMKFHQSIKDECRFVAMICGIRGGKTFAGAKESLRQAWNSKCDMNAVFGIVAPTYHMLDRTTWREFRHAARPFIHSENETKKIIVLKNGREVYGFSADNPDCIRNVTLCGFWIDEARECKDFKGLWDIMLGRVLSTKGKGIVTTSPNSYDGIHEVFIENKQKDYGTIRFSTYENSYLDKDAIDDLVSKYDEKFAKQEIGGEFVIFEGQVYYTFRRDKNAGDLAFKIAVYDQTRPLVLAFDFNVDPMSCVIAQVKEVSVGLKEVYVIDEIRMRNSNTIEVCQEFKARYPNHKSGLYLYGDATGEARTANSNVTNWKIIQAELSGYGLTKKVPSSNPNERDRINAVNAMLCNAKGVVRTLVNPKCKNLIRDLEQVSFKEGSVKIDKTKDLMLTHPSDAFGYFIEKEFSLIRSEIKGLKI